MPLTEQEKKEKLAEIRKEISGLKEEAISSCLYILARNNEDYAQIIFTNEDLFSKLQKTDPALISDVIPKILEKLSPQKYREIVSQNPSITSFVKDEVALNKLQQANITKKSAQLISGLANGSPQVLGEAAGKIVETALLVIANPTLHRKLPAAKLREITTFLDKELTSEVLAEAAQRHPSIEKAVLSVAKLFSKLSKNDKMKFLKDMNPEELCDAACQNDEVAVFVFENKSLYTKLIKEQIKSHFPMWESQEATDLITPILEQDSAKVLQAFFKSELTATISRHELRRFETMLAEHEAAVTNESSGKMEVHF